MAHVSFVQGTQASDPSVAGRRLHVPSSLVVVGVLGAQEQYVLPSAILEALASHLGGMVMDEVPPFLVACLDGMALVLTLSVGEEFIGAAFIVPAERLEAIDHSLGNLWRDAEKGQSSSQFFQDTLFQALGTTPSLPPSVEESWRQSAC